MLKLFEFCDKMLIIFCVIAFLLMFVLGIATIIFRFIIQSSLAFPEELIRYLFVWVIFLGSAVALRRNMHASIQLMTNYVSAGKSKLLRLIANLACCTFFLFLLIKGIEMVKVVSIQISPALEISMSYAYAAVPIGATFMLLFSVEALLKQLNNNSVS